MVDLDRLEKKIILLEKQLLEMSGLINELMEIKADKTKTIRAVDRIFGEINRIKEFTKYEDEKLNEEDRRDKSGIR